VGCWYKVLEVWSLIAETDAGTSCTWNGLFIVIGAWWFGKATVGEKCGLCMTRGVFEIG
jgi:hypothetical protein